MSKVNFNFLPDSTTEWAQTIKDSVTDYAGKSIQWIKETHRNEFVGYGMFAVVTVVTFIAADRIVTTFIARNDTYIERTKTTFTLDHKQVRSFLGNVVATGGLVYTANLFYSTLSGHTLPQTIILATTIAACAARYFLEARREGMSQNGNAEKKTI